MELNKLQEVIDRAIENYKSNKNSGAAAESLAYDSGRIAGLKEAMEIITREK